MKWKERFKKWLLRKPSKSDSFFVNLREAARTLHRWRGHHWAYNDNRSVRICINCGEEQWLMGRPPYNDRLEWVDMSSRRAELP